MSGDRADGDRGDAPSDHVASHKRSNVAPSAGGAARSAALHDGGNLQLTIDTPADAPWVAHHFPDQPIVPGSVLLELTLDALHRYDPVLRIDRVEQMRFVQPVTPGTQLTLSATLRAGQLTMRFKLLRGQETVASGVLRCAARDGTSKLVTDTAP